MIFLDRLAIRMLEIQEFNNDYLIGNIDNNKKNMDHSKRT